MTGSAFVKIDRLYDYEMQARARDAEKDKPITTSGILDFFREMTGFDPTAYQVALLLDPSQFIVARWSRQSGKSLCLTLICLFVALSGSNRWIAILAPSLRQSRAMIRRASSFLPKLPKNALEGAGVEDEAGVFQRVHGRGVSQQPRNRERVND